MRVILLIINLVFFYNLIAQDYSENSLYVKFKTNEGISNPIFLKLKEEYGFKRVEKCFVSKELSTIYLIDLKKNKKVSTQQIIVNLEKLVCIEYAEKVPKHKFFFTPNDPQYSSQWNLAKIQADLAWNIHQGTGTCVKIAVTDDGFLMNHEDLTNKWFINTGEIVGNGIDDDANGFIDDWRGWDAGNNDNNPAAFLPTNSNNTHGTHVAGIVAAETNNNLGIASIGFNLKMIPVKISQDATGWLTGAIKGVEYAIAANADVINMSWGGGGSSLTEQLVFDLAYSKGIICVAAAGNSSSASWMYPASYNHVISVAATSSNDALAWFSNYGTKIDVSAPGENILSCKAGATNSYGNFDGTSMASPLVAGLCGLMKCYNPMPLDSIEACLKQSCDNINAANPTMTGQFGAGRINANQALQCLTKAPVSTFYTKDTAQCIGKQVRYIATSFGAPTLTYNWTFPGGTPSSSTLKNPIVTYAANGIYSVTLTTTNGVGSNTSTKTNYIKIGPPTATLIGRKYTSYNVNPVIITVKFTGNPPFNVTLTDGTTNFTKTNIISNPYYFSIIPLKDTSYITISNYSDTQCLGTKLGVDTIYKLSTTSGGINYCESSLNFNGSTNCVVKIDKFNGANWKDLYSTNGYTWECWFNLGNRSSTTLTGIESLVGATDAILCEDLGLHFNWPWSGGGKLNWVISGESGCSAIKGVISTNMVFNANTWYHTAGVTDYSTNTVKLYVNGNQVATGTISIPLSQRMKSNVAVTIGNQDVNYNPYSGGFTPFNGKIDEVRFWNTARTSSEIQSSYKSCLPASTPNLVAYFKADEGTGTTTNSLVNGNFVGTLQNGAGWDTQVDSVKNCTLCTTNTTSDCDTTNLNTGKVLHLDFNGNTQDKSGNGNHATNNGATLVAGKDGITNTAYNFNGTSNYMQVANSTSLTSLTNITMTAILKPKGFYNGTCHGNAIIQKGTPDGIVGNYAMRYAPFNAGGCSSSDDINQNNFYGGFSTSSCSVSQIYSSPFVKKDSWYCVVLTYNGDSLKTYINGYLRLACKPATPIGSNLHDLFIGKLNSATFPYWLNADVDDIRIYNRVLASGEVKGYCGTCTIIPPPSDCDTTNLNTGKVLELDFNGNTQDKSGNSNHATNYGATPVAGKDGIPNTAYKFNGSSNYMKVFNSATLGMNSAYTVTCKMKIDGWNSGPCHGNMIFFKGNTTPSPGNQHIDWVYAPNAYNGSCIPILDTNHQNLLPASVTAPSPTAYTPYLHSGQWYCFTVVQKNDSLYNYIDGQLVYKIPNTGTGVNPYDIFIGKSNYASYPYWINATIDDIRVYNRSLAPSEVKGYCGTCTIIPPANIQCNNWLKSLGPNDRFTIGDLDVTGDKLTIEAWVNQKQFESGTWGTYDDREIVSKHNGQTNCNYNLRTGHAAIRTVNNGYVEVLVNCKNDTSKTYHIAMVYDGTLLKYYRNGYLMNTISASGNLVTNNLITNIANYAGPTIPGNNHSSKGYVNEVRIWNVARTQTQLRQNMSSSLPSPSTQPGLLAYYTFDNLINKQGNTTFNGTLSGGALINQTNPNCNLVIDSCGNKIIPPPIKCDTAKKFSFTKCANDNIILNSGLGSNYQWSPINDLSSDTIRKPICSLKSSQTYLVLYTDTNGCQLVDTVQVTVRNGAFYSPIADELICQGDSVHVIVPIYSSAVNWTPNTGISNSTIKNPYLFPLITTTYYLQFVDTFGCIQRDTIVVNVKTCCAARARFKLSDSILCYGIIPTITNTSKGPITSFNWNFGTAIPSSATTATPPYLNFPKGNTYPIRLIVSNGICQDTMIKNLNIIQFKPKAGKDSAVCLASLIMKLGSNPISNWNYRWTPINYLDDPTISNPTVILVNDSIQYIVEAEDKMSKCKFTDTVMVKTNLKIDSNVSSKRICYGDSVLFNGTQLKISGRYFYTIKTKDLLCDSLLFIKYVDVLKKDSTTFSPLIFCEFYIDKKGKKHTSSYMQMDTFRSTLGCDSFYHKTQINIFSKSYKESDIKACKEVIFKGKKHTTSTKHIDSTIIRGPYSGCDSIITYLNAVVLPIPIATIDATHPNPLRIKDTVTLTAKGGGTYLWLHNQSTNPVLKYKAYKVEVIYYKVRVTDSNQCWDTASYKIVSELDNDCIYGMPNVFTPNGDGINDIIIPNLTICADIQVFAIYNRWGEKVFETNQNKGWDGIYKSKPAPGGVYVYYLELNTSIGIKVYKGSVTLIR